MQAGSPEGLQESFALDPPRIQEDRSHADAIRAALKAAKGNRSEAASHLKVSRSYLYKEMRRLGLTGPP
jgi:transcriptional regulator of acetoin/glycerol metabolism